MTEPIRLRHGPFQASVSPAMGGSLLHFDWQGATTVPILRQAVAPREPTEAACFPLAPFSNCIARGRFRWEGETIQLPLHGGEEPDHALHGFAWVEPMAVTAISAHRIALTQAFRGERTPFHYMLHLIYALDDEGLGMTLSVTNVGMARMPCGLGFHPYLFLPKGAALRCGSLQKWGNGEDRLPTLPGPADDTVTKGASGLDRLEIDHCHQGWDGTAWLCAPTVPFDIRLTANLDWLVIYRPAGADWICIEPVSHLTDALNRPDPAEFGMRTLAPGETMEARMRIDAVMR